MATDETTSPIEVAVRRQLTRNARRIAPWIGVIGVLVTVLIVVPPADTVQLGADGSPGFTAGPGSSAQLTGPTGSSPDTAITGGGPGPSAQRPGGSAPASTLGTVSVGTGVSRAGVQCGPSVRQLPGSAYGAACYGAFSGDNGGATAPGVSADTIVVTNRIGTSGSSGALTAIGGSAINSLGGDQEAVAADMATLIAYFNEVFELYGRDVDLRTFTGQGDFIAEYQNQNIAGAQADGARARDLGAFADASIVTKSQPYSEALVSNEIIALSPVYMSEPWYARHQPFAFGVTIPDASATGQYFGNLTCRRLLGLNADFAGDPAMQGRERVFGLLHPENPEFAVMGDEVEAALSHCGGRIKRRITYALDVTTAQQQHSNAVAQFRAAGVTTVICGCDEFSPVFLTRAADQQLYRPEWVMVWWPDPWGRLFSQDQWAHSIHSGGTTPDYLDAEVGAVFRAASGGQAPQSPDAIALVYQQLVTLFSALQNAGPNLTARAFQQGWFAIPPTSDGVFGPWEFGNGIYNPRRFFQTGWWNERAVSRLDGQAGAIVSCAGGAWFRASDPETFGPPRTPHACFR